MSTQSTERAGGLAIGRTWEGVLLMVFTCACFAGMSAAIRHISAEISVFQIAFIRNAIGTLILVPFMFRIGFGSFDLGRFRLFAVRAGMGVFAMWAWYSALQITPLAEAITLNFTVSLWMIPVAILMLGERVGPRRWIATIVGFAGVLIVLQPGAETLSAGGLLAIFAALLFAISMALVRLLARSESPLAIVFYMNLIMTPISLGPGALVVGDADAGATRLAARHRLHPHDRALLDGARALDHGGDGDCAARLHPPPLRGPDRLVRVRRVSGHLDLGRRGLHRGQRRLHRPPRSAPRETPPRRHSPVDVGPFCDFCMHRRFAM